MSRLEIRFFSYSKACAKFVLVKLTNTNGIDDMIDNDIALLAIGWCHLTSIEMQLFI